MRGWCSEISGDVSVVSSSVEAKGKDIKSIVCLFKNFCFLKA